MDRPTKPDGSAGELAFLYPLCRDVKRQLRGTAERPCFS
jgi:hypothetical protein